MYWLSNEVLSCLIKKLTPVNVELSANELKKNMVSSTKYVLPHSSVIPWLCAKNTLIDTMKNTTNIRFKEHLPSKA
jgi:hypothetical protein